MAKAQEAGVSSLEEHIGFWLRFVSNHVSGRFQGLVEEQGVSLSEWVALRQLYGAGRVSPAKLIDSLGMTKGAISKVLDRLETKALVRRVSDPSDGRAQFVELTRAGRTLVPRLARIADENDRHFFGKLAPATRDALVQTLLTIVREHELKQIPID
ncbi:MAG: hypothetical protein RL701_256 [Pseudomonadota bacterium]